MKKKKIKLFWQLYPTYLLVTLATIFILAITAKYTIQNSVYDEAVMTLESKAKLLAKEFSKDISTLEQSDIKEIQQITNRLAKKAQTRISFIAPDGNVLADSAFPTNKMDNHSDRPEIKAALMGAIGTSRRFSPTLQENLLYLALPIRGGEKVKSVLRLSLRVPILDQTINKIIKNFLVSGIPLFLVLIALAYWISKRMSRPLELMRDHADKFAQGDFTKRIELPPFSSQEMETLSEALNETGGQLQKRIHKIVRQKNEKEAMFSSMIEGVLTIDRKMRIKNINHATFRLFELGEQKDVKGIPVKDIFEKYPVVLELTQEILNDQEFVEREIELDGRKFIKVHGSPLHQDGLKMGVILVFADVTRLRKLEHHRKQFVGNVSHELRTPLTSIQGFVETLKEEGIDDQTREKFLNIIQKQTYRLNVLIDDLLTLSRIERETEEEEIELLPINILGPVHSAIDLCGFKAVKKNTKINLIESGEPITCLAHNGLFEQAITNLIINAIKYGPENSEVTVKTETKDGKAFISVSDLGQGIPAKHLERLFERFYSVNKARSRELGGSGLGLSIVKHIALAHHGEVWAESEVGKGSIFKISLPLFKMPHPAHYLNDSILS